MDLFYFFENKFGKYSFSNLLINLLSLTRLVHQNKEKGSVAVCRITKKQKLIKQEKLTDICPIRKKRDRFNGLTEDEVLAKTLPDHLAYDLDIVIVCFILRHV